MSTVTPDRVVELWPGLPEETRRRIVEIAEGGVAKEQRLDLSVEEEAMIQRSREDFRDGRALDSDEYREEMAVFMRRLASGSP